MHPRQLQAFRHEMDLARQREHCGDFAGAMRHLERAHVLGQAEVLPHVRTHWHMLRLEWRRRHPGAVLGQAVRILLGGIGSAVGVIPTGNTGGSDVNMFRRMPVDPELDALMRERDPR